MCHKISIIELLAKMYEKIVWVIDTADHKIGDFKVEFLGEHKSTYIQKGFKQRVSVPGGVV
jgi:hypothetical protein